MTPENVPGQSSPEVELGEEAAAIKQQVERILGAEAKFEAAGKLPAFRVAASQARQACQKLREGGFDYLIFVTAVDYPDQKRFEMVYALSNFADGRQFCLVADVDRESPKIDTVSDIWATADWHEREVYDLFGIEFENHPDLRRILLDDTWEGHPLRKDYVDKVHDVVHRPY